MIHGCWPAANTFESVRRWWVPTSNIALPTCTTYVQPWPVVTFVSADPHQASGRLPPLGLKQASGRVPAAACLFDEEVLAAYEKLAGLDPLTADEQAQCRLPLRFGGRGLRSQERLAPAAWAGSWAQNLSEVKGRSGLACLADLEPAASGCLQERACCATSSERERGGTTELAGAGAGAAAQGTEAA